MLRIVPWSSRDEWLTTYNDLYNFENIDQQIEGLNRVEAWKSRSGSKLPLAVESTASLIAAGVEDVRSVVNANVIRHTMAMALVRFVSGIVDMEQKHAYARSMQSIADDIGLPDWLVDLRHEAIHANLPSMQVVRAGCRFALEWLKEHYWDSQIKEFADRDKALTLLLQDYAKCFDDAKKKKNFGIKSKMKVIIHEIQDLVSKFNMWQRFFDLSFGEKWLLLPSYDILRERLPVKKPIELPKETATFLSPLFKSLQLANSHFITMLVRFFLKQMETCEESSKSDEKLCLYTSILIFILKQCHGKNNLFINKRYFISLLETCLKNPSKHTKDILPLIIENLKIEEETKEKLFKLADFHVFMTTRTNMYEMMEDKDYDVLKKCYPEIMNKLQANVINLKDSGSHWKTCSSNFTHNYTFGTFIGVESGRSDESEKIRKYNETRVNEVLENELHMEKTILLSHDNENNDLDTENHGESDFMCLDIVNGEDLTSEMIEDISKNIWIL